MRYRLRAVITHKGRTVHSGHYMAWVCHYPSSPSGQHTAKGKASSGIWYCFDDDQVSQVSETDIKALEGGGDWHSAYLLIYEKIPCSELEDD